MHLRLVSLLVTIIVPLIFHFEFDLIPFSNYIFFIFFNPFTGDFTVTVSDIKGFYFYFFSIKFIVKQVFE